MTVSVSDAMTPAERRIGASLAAVFALRMLGLFLILPVFSLYAHQLEGGDNLMLVGLAIGAYGLTQAFLQIPFGLLSDRIGRKPVIVFGLLLFVAGSAVAALAHSIHWVIAGRVIQGAGAISAAVTALAADLTREQHRTKIMAMIGSSIALVFALSMLLAPLLYSSIGMPGIFWMTGVLALLAIVVIWKVIPDAPPQPRQAGGRLREVVRDGQLMRLNFGVFSLHLIQMTMWVLVPVALVSGGLAPAAHWKVYLPAVLLSFIFMVPAILFAERQGHIKAVFNCAIVILALVQVGLYLSGSNLIGLTACLTLFFVAFNVLEALQPSWISRIAPPAIRGGALGVYNTLQSIGLFLGGTLGGALAQHFGNGAVNLACIAISLAWLLLATTVKPPPFRTTAVR